MSDPQNHERRRSSKALFSQPGSGSASPTSESKLSFHSRLSSIIVGGTSRSSVQNSTDSDQEPIPEPLPSEEDNSEEINPPMDKHHRPLQLHAKIPRAPRALSANDVSASSGRVDEMLLDDSTSFIPGGVRAETTSIGSKSTSLTATTASLVQLPSSSSISWSSASNILNSATDTRLGQRRVKKQSGEFSLTSFTRRLKDVVGMAEFDSKIWRPFDVTADNVEVGISTDDLDIPDSSREELDLEDEEETSSSSISALRHLRVYFGSNKESSMMKIPLAGPVVDMVAAILSQSDRKPVDLESWRIARLDRNQLVTRVWLSDENLTSVKMSDGDEIRIKNVNEHDSLRYSIPPQPDVHQCPFGYTDSVKDVADRLLSLHQMTSSSSSFGLYYKRMGIWLDERRDMMTYELNPEHALELREKSQEFLLRVQLPDFDTRFAIKVIPSLTVSDVRGIIMHNINSRGLSLERLFRGGLSMEAADFPQCRYIQYGLCLANSQQWMVEDRTVESYDLQQFPQDIQFRRQYQTISIERSLLHRRDLFKERIQIFTAEEMTVADLIESIGVSSCNSDEDVSTIAFDGGSTSGYGIFTKGGEPLRPSDLVWSILREASPQEIFEYRSAPRRLTFTSTLDQKHEFPMDVDPTKPLGHYFPTLWRKFGASEAMEFRGCFRQDSDLPLDELEPILDLRITQNMQPIVVRMNWRKGFSPEASTAADEQRSIWDEGPDDASNISLSLDSNRLVLAASLNKLIEKLTSEDETAATTEYLDFMKTFLLTYQSFTTPSIFLRKLIERYHVPRKMDEPFDGFEKRRLKIQLRVCNVLQQWTKKYYTDFIDAKGTHTVTIMRHDVQRKLGDTKDVLLSQVLHFSETILVQDHPTLGRQLRKHVMKIRDGSILTQTATFKHSAPPPIPIMSKAASVSVDSSKLTVFSHSPEEIARQLTIMEFDLFSKIMPYEFLNQAWTKSDADSRAPNILAITRRFNELAFFVVKSVLDVKTVRARAKRLMKLVDVACHLYKMNNFSSLMAFIAGFNKSPLTRLKYTLKELPGRTLKRLSELEKLMSAESAYKVYRYRLHSVNPPCIPYLGVYLLDLTYMEDGNPNKIGPLINFSKRRLINTLIREVQQYQNEPYNLLPVMDIVQLIDLALKMPFSLDSASGGGTSTTMKNFEDELFHLSLEREPRGAERNQII